MLCPMHTLDHLIYFGPESCLMQHEWKMSHDDAGGSECFLKINHIKSHTRLASATFPKVDVVVEVIQESKENPEQSGHSQRFSSFSSLSCWKLRFLNWTQPRRYTHGSTEAEQSMQTVTVEVAMTDMLTYLWWSHGWLTNSSVERLVHSKLIVSTSGKYCCFPPSFPFNHSWPF